jgi:hypothetical protein
MLHRVSAKLHVANIVITFLTKEFSAPPPYSPELAPCDFLFPALESSFEDSTPRPRMLQSNLRTRFLKNISKNGFDHAFEERQNAGISELSSGELILKGNARVTIQNKGNFF